MVVLRGSVRVLRGRRLGAAGDVLCVEGSAHLTGVAGGALLVTMVVV